MASRMQSKFCPVLRFARDEKFKKTLETMRLIDEAAEQSLERESGGEEPEGNSDG